MCNLQWAFMAIPITKRSAALASILSGVLLTTLKLAVGVATGSLAILAEAAHSALDLLAAEDPASANLVKLRYFVGMTMEEAAEALGIPLRTAGRLWTYSRAWLRRKIGGGPV